MEGIREKVAIITGGASGIGRQTALRLAEEGAMVVVADRNLTPIKEAAANSDGAIVPMEFDAADEDSIRSVVKETAKRYGRIDILHNNVAMTAEAWSTDTTVLDTSLQIWDLTMTINLRSMFIASQAVLPYMLEQGGGSIINMSSGAGLMGMPSLVAYGTSKGGVVTFTKYLAVQYGRDNIRTNCVAPGLIKTQQILDNVPDQGDSFVVTLPFHRTGTTEDIAALVAFLCSDDAKFINGQVIHCDGGGSAGSQLPKASN